MILSVLVVGVRYLVYGQVPPAKMCLPSAHLKELSGCIDMINKEDECAAKDTRDNQLDCYCVQEMLTAYYEYVPPILCRCSPETR